MRAFDDESVSWHTGDVIDGKYEVTRILGRGGMGQVHCVRHLGWGIDLAVKSPLPDLFSGPDDVDRFVAEAQTWVSLGLHPNVCGCHYVRVLGGVPRLFAELVPGGSLRGRIEDRSLYRGGQARAAARILRIAGQMARGLEHSHSRGVLHLDVKPANVLLDGGTAKITDFGLAKARAAAVQGPAADGATLAVMGGGGMTPAYAPPEQASGASVSRRSDVYSFAVSVLEMFTGGVSWRAGSVAGAALEALLRGAAAEPGIPPLPADLARLLRRCLSTDPRPRPNSMAEVAEELEALYAATTTDEPPLTPPTAVELRAGEHNNRALSLLDLGASADAEFRAALDIDSHHLDAAYNSGLLRWRNGESTDDDLLSTVQVAREHAGDPWQARCLLAQIHLERGDLDRARAILDDLVHDHPAEPEVRDALRALESGRTGRTDEGDVTHAPWNRSTGLMRPRCRFSHDGAYLSAWSREGPVRLWDVDSGTCRHTRATVDDIPAVQHQRAEYSDDGRIRVDVAGGAIRVWDLKGEAYVVRPRYLENVEPAGPGRDSRICDLRIAPDGRSLFMTSHQGEAYVWDVGTGSLRARFAGFEQYTLMNVSNDGSQAVAVTHDSGAGRLVHLDIGRHQERVLAEFHGPVPTVAIAADGNTAVSVTSGHRLQVWDLNSGECRLRTMTVTGGIGALAVGDDARRMLSGGRDGLVRLWDVESGRCVRTFRGHTGSVDAVWLSPDGEFGRSAGVDNTIRSWTWRLPVGYRAPLQLSLPRGSAEISRLSGEVRELVREADRATSGAAFAEAHALLTRARSITGHERDPGVLRAWRDLGRHLPATGLKAAWTVRLLFREESMRVFRVSLTADARIAAVSHDHRAHLWDLETGSWIRELPLKPADYVALSSDGQRVMAAFGGSIKVWSTHGEDELCSLHRAETGGAESLVVTADCSTALFVTHDDRLVVWDLRSARCLLNLTGHTGRPRATWIDPAGRIAASACIDSVRLWNLRSGELLRELPLEPSEYAPTLVCVDPSGEFVVAVAYGGSSLLMWNSAGEFIRRFEDSGWVTSVGFSPDGRFLVVGGASGAITVWDAASGRRVTTLDGHHSSVRDIRLTPDRRYALSGSSDGTVRLWELDWDLAVPVGGGES